MKITASILGVYILFLAVLPSLVHLTGPSKKNSHGTSFCLCSNSCDNKPVPSKEGERPNSKRTPFFGCPKMHVVIPAEPVLICKPVFNGNYVVHYTDPGVFTSYSAVWHPPKAVL